MPTPTSGADLIRATGLMPDGPAVLGRPIRANGPGVYVVELNGPLPRAPIDITIVGKWIERLPDLRLDRERPTSKSLAARLAAFWVPSSPVLFVGSTEKSIAGRVTALERHVLGDRQPHASAQWLKTLRVDAFRVWWASTREPDLYEDGVLDAFAEAVTPDERAVLYDSVVVLPFANLRSPTGDRKKTGITGAVVPDDRVPAPPTRVVDLPPGDADGVEAPKAAGSTRRTNVTRPPAPGVRVPKARTPAGRSTRISTPATAAAAAPSANRGPVTPLELTPDGMDRLQAEYTELTQVRRPAVIERIVRARELGDLKENADYTAAREEQSFLEGRIQAIEAQLRFAVVVGAGDATRVTLGSRVNVELDGEDQEFTVVGPAESDPKVGRISSVSPVGKALLGKSAGDEAVVTTPRGKVRYRVISIA